MKFGNMKGVKAGFCLFLLTLFVYGQAQAENAIQNISSSLQGGSEVIQLEFSNELAAPPNGFAIQVPARIALDFPGVVNATGKSSMDLNQGNLRSVNIVQAGERTRLVLNLKQAATYRTAIAGKTLTVTLSTGAAPAAAAQAPVFAESQNTATLPLRDLDFRRGSDNAGRVVVELPNNQVGVDIKTQGQTLVVDFLKTSLPEGLRRKLDVVDFGTPVKTITTFQSGDRTRVVIEPTGAWEHSAYQSDNQFVVEIRPQRVDADKLTKGPGYSGEKLSLNFQNIEVRALLQVIADFTNFNVITSDTVAGSLTLRLKDVPWDQALDIILQSKGLGMRKTGNVLLIAPKDELATKEKQDLEARATVQNLEPLRTQTFQLNYTKAAEVAKSLIGQSGAGATKILSQRGSVIPEPRTNQLFVTDIPSRLEDVQALIAKLDIPGRQVLIEARIVEASDDFSKSLGVKLGGGGQRPVGKDYMRVGSNYNAVTPSTKLGGDANNLFVNLPASGSAGNIAVSLFNAAATRFIGLEISAMESDGKGREVASPRVVTSDQTKAIIEQGTELPYQTATSSGATSIAFRKANLKLEVTPQITPEGNIILDLDINKDTVGRATAAGFAIDTKHVTTQALVENGGTVVIGGIYTMVESGGQDKVPVLGDLPILGNLFKNNTTSIVKKETLIFITPKVIADRSALR